MKNLYSICVIMSFVSFLGFVIENLWLALTKGYIDNRNMIFPFLFGYGLTISLIYMAFGIPQEPSFFGKQISTGSPLTMVLYFVIIFICVSLGEIILGKTTEKLCHIQWWDYSKLPMHITQYTSVFTSLGFTVMIVSFMDKIYTPMLNWISAWDINVLKNTAIISSSIIIADFLHSAYLMYKRKSFIMIWKIDISHLIARLKNNLIRSSKH